MTFNTSTLFLLTALIAALVMIGTVSPPLGLGMAMLSLPPLVRTALVLNRRRLLYPGETHTAAYKARLFGVSCFITAIIIWLTIFLPIGAILGTGLFLMTVLSFLPSAEETSLWVSFLVAPAVGATVAVALIVIFTKWVLFRWERDTGSSMKS
jgi:hypothetical protein